MDFQENNGDNMQHVERCTDRHLDYRLAKTDPTAQTVSDSIGTDRRLYTQELPVRC